MVFLCVKWRGADVERTSRLLPSYTIISCLLSPVFSVRKPWLIGHAVQNVRNTNRFRLERHRCGNDGALPKLNNGKSPLIGGERPWLIDMGEGEVAGDKKAK